MSRIYVIAAYTHAPQVRAIHDRLRMLGHEPTSSWAEGACGEERLDEMPTAEVDEIARRNRADMAAANVALALLDTPMRQGWLELADAAGFHAMRGMHIYLVGRHCLDTRLWTDLWRRKVCRHFPDVDAALAALGGAS